MNTTELSTSTNGADSDARERVEVVVIGAGQAGLAIGHFLAREGRRFVILEAGDSVGRVAEPLGLAVLFTPRRYDAFPGSPFPATPTAIRRATRSSPTSSSTRRRSSCRSSSAAAVRSLTARTAASSSSSTTAAIEADQVVVATGPFQVPSVPALAGELAPEVVPDAQRRLPAPERRA